MCVGRPAAPTGTTFGSFSTSASQRRDTFSKQVGKWKTKYLFSLIYLMKVNDMSKFTTLAPGCLGKYIHIKFNSKTFSEKKI
jgi:hypothetical protein